MNIQKTSSERLIYVEFTSFARQVIHYFQCQHRDCSGITGKLVKKCYMFFLFYKQSSFTFKYEYYESCVDDYYLLRVSNIRIHFKRQPFRIQFFLNIAKSVVSGRISFLFKYLAYCTNFEKKICCCCCFLYYQCFNYHCYHYYYCLY